MNIPSLLKNKYIFYGLLTLEILSIISYIYAREYKCLVLLILTSYSAYCKFNNKSLAILISLFASNVLFSCKKITEGWQASLPTCKKVHIQDVTKSNNRNLPSDHTDAPKNERQKRATACIRAMSPSHCGECAPDLKKNPNAVRRWL
tara:strand:- start:262 stop:702 length:441 start_codon:yes stop_codon:yes gene_type:complete